MEVFSVLAIILMLCGLLQGMHPVNSIETNALESAITLECPPCEKIHCSPRRASKLRCKGGITRGICNCCPKCAKVEGETCGGHLNFMGKCDRGLRCSINREKTYNHSKYPNGTGTCVPEPIQQTQGYPHYCKPKCTPGYCRRNPKAICAAIDNFDKKQACQGDCQHTSCSACRFVEEEPDCIKCGQNDFRCMRQFARCIKKKSFCSRQKFPCKKYTKKTEPGVFKCMVPQCLTS